VTRPFTIALGTFQDEYELSGEFQVFIGWLERLKAAAVSTQVFSPVGAGLRARGFTSSRYGESLLAKWKEAWAFIEEAVRQSTTADVVHLFLPTPNFLWIADRVKARCPKPVIVSCFGEKPDGPFSQVLIDVFKSARFYGVRYLSGWVTPRPKFLCDRYLAGSQAIAAQLQKAGCPVDRVQLFQPLLPTDIENADADTLEAAAAMRTRPTFLYIGHFLPNKGVDVMLDALARTRRPECGALLVWSGFGDEAGVRKRIRRLGLEKRVTVISRRVHRPTLFAQACALVLPFQSSIGQVSPPVIVLEAFRSGVPLLVSPIMAVREWAEDGHQAFFINPRDSGQIARQMDALLESPEKGTLMRQAQKDRYAERMRSIDLLGLYSPLANTCHG
jgi:glycosyltransferase involved in cell wall biosynthesis